MLQLINDTLCQFNYPFDINRLELDRDKPLSVQLDEEINLLEELYSSDYEIHSIIRNLSEGVGILLKNAPLYDFDENVHANGYWTFSILSIKCCKICSDPSLISKIGRKPILHLLQVVERGMNVCLEMIEGKLENSNDHMKHDLFVGHLDFISLIELIRMSQDQLTTIYEHFNFCWLGTMSNVMNFLANFLAIFWAHWKSLTIRNLLRKRTRAEMCAQMILAINVDCLKFVWNIQDYYLLKYFMPSFWKILSIRTKDVYCPRQQRWIIDQFKPVVHDLNEGSNIPYPKCRKNFIRCLLMTCRNGKNFDKSLMIHLHGGGFISQSPESHSVYLIEWVKKLEKTPILSIDYSLSPEAAFPEAMQEVLDCYLWILSKDPEVKKAIGFHPEKIVICGDSAGGNFAISLMAMLSYMQKKIRTSKENMGNYRYPDGLVIFYAALVLPTSKICPSRILSSMDGLIPLGALLNCLASYVPSGVYEENQINETLNENESLLHKTLSAPVDFLNYLKDILGIKRTKPWFQKTTDLKKCCGKMNKFLENPFVSPLFLPTMDFNHIPLYIYPSNYDPLLDDNIELAKRWRKDKIHIQVCDNVPHGFLNLIDFNSDVKALSMKCFEQFRHLFD